MIIFHLDTDVLVVPTFPLPRVQMVAPYQIPRSLLAPEVLEQTSSVPNADHCLEMPANIDVLLLAIISQHFLYSLLYRSILNIG